MSISVVGVELTPLLKTIPALFEKSDLLELAFGSEPVIKLIAWVAVTLKIDFISAAPDFFVTWCVVCRGILCMRLNGTCVMFQSLISFAFRCHTGILILSYLNCSRSQRGHPCHLHAASPDRGKSGPAATITVRLFQKRKTIPAEGWAVCVVVPE